VFDQCRFKDGFCPFSTNGIYCGLINNSENKIEKLKACPKDSPVKVKKKTKRQLK
jgi:hypothetical protein